MAKKRDNSSGDTRSQDVQPTRIQQSGNWLLGIAIILGIYAIGMDTSVPTVSGDRIHNIGLLSLQLDVLLIAAALFIGGIVLSVVGRSTELEGDLKTCPFCAEEIKATAIVCRFCGRDVPVQPKAVAKPEPDDGGKPGTCGDAGNELDAETEWSLQQLRQDGHNIDVVENESALAASPKVLFRIDNDVSITADELRNLARGECSYEELKLRNDMGNRKTLNE